MTTVILVIHMLIALALIGLILLQRTEGGMGGMGGGASGPSFGGLMTSRGSANFLTRTTAILAASFMATSILLAILAGTDRTPRSILDEPIRPMTQPTAPDAPAPPPAPPIAE